MAPRPPTQDREKLALLGLWAVPGVGPRTVEGLRARAGGEGLGPLLDAPAREWAAELPVPRPVRARLLSAPPLPELAGDVLDRCERKGILIAFRGDAAYPRNLASVRDAPPLLFYRGQPSAPRRMVAMVGSRKPENGFTGWARAFAREVARGGVGLVSGAAIGVDQAAHQGALDAGQVTWAFLGSALDQVDPAQARVVPEILDGGGLVFTELPPGVRASRDSFPRRNRLISGASDAVLVLRATTRSGSLYTAYSAIQQGRPLYALPGDLRNEAAVGCNTLIRTGHARLCLGPADVWAAVGVKPDLQARPARPGTKPSPSGLSEAARTVWRLLRRTPEPYDELFERAGMESAELTSALCELELLGLVFQHPGKQYERV